MANKLWITVFALSIAMKIPALAQYGNEWIDFNQQYFKFNIVEEGIYRISRTDLANAGFPVSTVDPRKIQIFHQGIEMAIEVAGQADGVFNSSDYVQFYAKGADGTSDIPLYITADHQPHPYYNLFSDSAAYFITYKLNLDNGLRLDDFFENNSGGLPAQTFYTQEDLTVYFDNYHTGTAYGISNQVLLAGYDRGEGWTGTAASQGQNIDHTFTSVDDVATSETPPTLELLLAGRNNNIHDVDIFVGPNSGSTRLLENVQFIANQTLLVEEALAWSDVSAGGEVFVRAAVNGVDGGADRVSISYAKLVFNRGFDLNDASEQKLTLQANPGNQSYLELDNPPSNALLYDITDFYNPIEIGYNGTNPITAIVDNTAISRTLFLQSGTKSIDDLKEITLQSIDPTLFNYLIITDNRLRGNTSDGQTDQVAAYRAYRESEPGGSHQVVIASIDQLFNQFSYGQPTPMAIRRYTQYMYDNGAPEFLFIIGKASNISDNYYRQDPNITSIRHFVPTYGQPGGDSPFTAGFDGGIGYETIPTGRINADHPDDIQAYLNKVIEEESLPFTSLRQKDLIHLSGGNSESELVAFRGYIDGFAQSAADLYLGGESAQVSKNNNAAVQFINITEQVNDGVMLITFFGHSSGSITDLEIGLVSDPANGFANKGKYPVFLINGCRAGDFFSDSESFGVDWILTPNLGALGFIAHSHVAFSSNLRRYSDLFYELAFNDPDYITRSIGEIKAETSKRYVENIGSSETSLAQIQLENLQGDPAVKIFGADLPDFSLDADLITFGTFDEEPILASTDSFYVDLNIKNFGIGTDDEMAIEVTRVFPTGLSQTIGPTLYPATLREDTIRITIPNDMANVTGLNTFSISIDPFSSIEELDETNNRVTLELFVSSGSTINLLPSNYGIETEEEITFYFQAANVLTSARSYEFQLDTTSTFDSPYLRTQSFEADIVGTVDMNFGTSSSIPDGTAIYWRTKFSEIRENESDEWEVSSFVLDRTKSEGWSQQRPSQLAEMGIEGLEVDASTGFWDFISTSLNLEVVAFGADNSAFDHLDTQVLIGGQDFFNTTSQFNNVDCNDNSINFIAFDRQSTVPFSPFTFGFADELNSLICGRLPQYIYNYEASDMSGTYEPVNYLDELSDGDHVLIFSLGDVDYSSWSSALLDAIENLGINRADLDDLALGGNEPVIMLGAKGAAANAGQIIRTPVANPNEGEVRLPANTTIEGDFDSGSISTTLIGPARSWGMANMNITDSNNPGDDSRILKVIGIDANGNETEVYSQEGSTEVDLGPSGINVDPAVYPFVRLRLEVADEIQSTPPQLSNWELQYETAPEAVLFKRDRSDIDTPNKLQEGQPYASTFTFWNISEKDFADSLQIDYSLFNVANGQRSNHLITTPALVGGDSTQFTLDFNTLGQAGNQDVFIDANKQDQVERILVNNSLRIADYLEVEADNTNPIVEVTFDGMTIIDGDIVSPNPHILITVKDDNPYILKQDTLGINFFLKLPCQDCEFDRIPFSNPDVNWEPTTDLGAFQIDYRPESLEDGIYTLRVQAVDGIGNQSGIKPYEIRFEVINASTITNFYPYPNPFSTSTRFVFTLTGSVLPEDIKIQILTISGRVVKEIFMDELGPIRIGNNRTEFAWDGRDRYGDQLANGVYLYRVLIKNPGENFEHRETKGDRSFKHGFGKMYLLR